jgi:indolepyruvate ferredoxin oxidoreductase
VARLALDAGFQDGVTAAFGPGGRLHYRLHPPILRALGARRKLALGRWFEVGFRILRGMKGLRGTPLDPFGYHPIRRLERELIGEYQSLIETELARLDPTTYDRAIRLARLPDMIRGYEEVKRNNVMRYRAAVADLLAPREPAIAAPARV